MQPKQEQQQNLGAFIQEVRDYLHTIELGLLDLQTTVEDPEKINNVLQAAQSLQTEARKQGNDSLNQIAHHLADYFRVLQDSSVTVDQKLEPLLWQVYETLQGLVELHAPTEDSPELPPLTDELERQIISGVESVFEKIDNYLEQLPGSTSSSASVEKEKQTSNEETEPSQLLDEFTDMPDSSTHEEVDNLGSWLEDNIAEFEQDSNEGKLDAETAGSSTGEAEEAESNNASEPPIWQDFFDWAESESLEAHDLSEFDREVEQQPLSLATESSEGTSRQWQLDEEWGEDLDSLEDFEALFADTEDNPIPSESREVEGVEEDEEVSTSLSTPTPATDTEDTESRFALVDYYEQFDQLEALLEEAAAGAVEINGATSEQIQELEALIAQPATTDGNEATVSPQESEFNQEEEQEQAVNRSVRGQTAARFEQTLRVPVKQLDNLSNLIGELVVNRNGIEQDQQRLREFLDNLLGRVQDLNKLGERMEDLYERSLLENSLLASRPGSGGTTTAEGESSSASAASQAFLADSTDQNYNSLEMDRFSGFHILSQEMIELIVRVRESSSDIEFLVDEIDQEARTLRRVTTQLQEGMTQARMVPFSQMADRLPRAVRDISLKLNKQAQLHLEGRDTLVDKMILEQLYDSMTHLVNNSITHGIESPEVRQAAGKPTAGQITLRAIEQGNQTLISLSDDGAGIDPERVKAKAIDKQLVSVAEAENLTESEIYDYIFHPGFSTRDQADDFAGRGVGMDVVRTALSKLRGTISIDSTLGQGTTCTIGLPLTLSIGKALCCVHEKTRIAFPLDGVEDSLDVSPDEIQADASGDRYLQWRNTLVPFKSLSELFSYNRQLDQSIVYDTPEEEEDDSLSVVVVRSTPNLVAIQLDQVIGEQEIAMKQLRGPVPKPAGIAGATVLGDGRIMAIADMIELVDLFQGRIRKVEACKLEQQEPAPHKSEPMVLIVDDSITVRELLSMSFRKAGYRVEQARDGQQAWDKLRSGLPCELVFCDIEMPRMDGLELLSRLRESLASLPVGMLTSRGAQRHKKMASQLGAQAYFTKPYLEEVLLDAAQRMMQGEILLDASS
ncbi:MAG: hybrid sensor histidine kinase/response regulator [Cyanobacteria bacterium QS_7_48_42]|nr:MAG: hybrid sensor histidine kinase/response regulator [Cyanobacteria bacterium QS_7_48_42]